MKLILIGIPGAGKSTQGNLLSRQLKIPYLSTGHIFRKIAKEKTRLGRYVKETINAGLLIPDNKVIQIVNDYLARPEYKKGYILDGFPRTLKQAKSFKNNVDKVIYLKIPDKEALWRLAYRNDSLRNDDTVAAVRKRIEIFHQYTEPVIKYYQRQGRLLIIDGIKSIPEVNQEILKSLGKQLVKNQVKEWSQKRKAIIAIVGLPGAGKTEAVNYFRKKGLPIVSFGRIINDIVSKKYKKHTEMIHKKIREEIREKYGKEALAFLNERKIREALNGNMVVVIDGLRSWEEYLFLKDKFPKTRIFILAIFADKAVRYKRISNRRSRSKLYGEERDLNEIFGTNMGPTFAWADFLVKNNFYLEDFYDKLDEVYRRVIFT